MNEQTLQPTVSSTPQQITITVGGSTPTLEVSTPEDKQGTKDTSVKETAVDGLAKDPVAEDAEGLIPQVPYYSDPLFYEVANYFGLKQEDYDSAKNKLSDIVEYSIREVNSNKVEDIVPFIRAMEDSIQSPGWDERRYANLHKYIRLADKKQTIGKMMKAYEKGRK